MHTVIHCYSHANKAYCCCRCCCYLQCKICVIGNGSLKASFDSNLASYSAAIPYSSLGKGVGGSVVRKGLVHRSSIKRANQVGSWVGQMVSEIQD